jgi:hypothetical protein
MNRPEEDPVVVTLVASNLLGRICQDWRTACEEARQGLKVAAKVIRLSVERS